MDSRNTGDVCAHCGADVPKKSPCDWFCCESHQKAWHCQRVGVTYDEDYVDPMAYWGRWLQ